MILNEGFSKMSGVFLKYLNVSGAIDLLKDISCKCKSNKLYVLYNTNFITHQKYECKPCLWFDMDHYVNIYFNQL